MAKTITGTATLLPDLIERADEQGDPFAGVQEQSEPTPTAALATIEAPEVDSAKLSRGDIKAIFDPLYAQMEALRDRALAIVVTDENQIAKMKQARELRLLIRAIRITTEKYRKPMVEDYTRRKSAVDTVARTIKIGCEPLETHLEEQEKYVERKAAERLNAMLAERTAQLVALGEDPLLYVLDRSTPEEWDAHIAKIQEQKDMRETEAAEAERRRVEKIESDRIAAEELRKHAIEQSQRAQAAEDEAERIREEARIAEEAAQEQRNRERRDFQAKEDAERVKAAEAQRVAVAAANAKAEKAKKAAEDKARKELEAAAQKHADEQAALKAQMEADKRRNAAMIEMLPVIVCGLQLIADGKQIGTPAHHAKGVLAMMREKGIIS